MLTATIKVPVDLRDRIAERARHEHVTLARAIAHALDIADEARFWTEVRTTMGSAHAHNALKKETEEFTPSLADGLEPEDWSDIL
jgi:hypothetical protein